MIFLLNFLKGHAMKKMKVVLDFVKFPVKEKVTFYRNVIANLTSNLSFPNPDASLTEAKNVVDALENSILARIDGSRVALSAMHDAEAAADALFRILAAYVERIALGDETSIFSSGFHGSKQPTLAQKATLSVIDGTHSGTVKLIAKAVEKSGSYIWQYAQDTVPDTQSGWTDAGICTRSTFEISDLNVASKYYFRVAAVTPDGSQDFSAPVFKVVQ
jgi:hypothetical protein